MNDLQLQRFLTLDHPYQPYFLRIFDPSYL
jgi:hypothetical protein